jgi:hypothetical protein
MATLLILITTRTDHAHDLGDAWQRLGVSGVTFIESYGIQGLREARRSVEVLPGTLSMLELLRSQERNSVVAMTVLHDEAMVDPIVKATEDILGSLDEPDNGLIFTIPIDRLFGLRFHD